MRKSGEFRTASIPGDERRTTATAVDGWLRGAVGGAVPEHPGGYFGPQFGSISCGVKGRMLGRMLGECWGECCKC
jgi:hypothetical protein